MSFCKRLLKILIFAKYTVLINIHKAIELHNKFGRIYNVQFPSGRLEYRAPGYQANRELLSHKVTAIQLFTCERSISIIGCHSYVRSISVSLLHSLFLNLSFHRTHNAILKH